MTDAEREHVGQLLQRAVGHGMLTVGEFDERMRVALAARTRAELNAVLVDLPGVTWREPGGGQWRAAPPPPDAAATVWTRGTMSNITRSGAWEVPPNLGLRTRLSSTKLNFTKAVLRGPVVRVRLDEAFSSTTLVIPPGASADCSGVRGFAATIEGNVSAAPSAGAPHFVVEGTVRLGSLTVRYPHSEKLRKLMA